MNLFLLTCRLPGLISILLSLTSICRASGFAEDCPYGHHRLVEIPIVYGFGLSKEDSERLKLMEIEYGGEASEPKSPTTRLICNVCRCRYFPEANIWVRHSNYSSDLVDSLPELMRTFSLPQETSRSFSLTFYPDGRVKESVVVIGLAFASYNEEYLSSWAKSHAGVLISHSRADKRDPGLLTDQWENRNDGWTLSFEGIAGLESYATLSRIRQNTSTRSSIATPK